MSSASSVSLAKRASVNPATQSTGALERTNTASRLSGNLPACKTPLACASIRTGAPLVLRKGERLRERYQGQSLNRLEDLRFLTGRGTYVANDHVANVLHAHVVRSPHAFARITRLSLEAARALPGVVAVLSEADLAADGIGELPCVTVI